MGEVEKNGMLFIDENDEPETIIEKNSQGYLFVDDEPISET